MLFGIPSLPRSHPLSNCNRTYELESAPLLLNFAPSIVARKAVRARNKLIGAFAKYYETGALDDASELAKARYKPPADYGLQKSDIARLEPPFIFAVVATSVPSCFWAFVEIFAQPDLVSELRQEIGKVVTVDRKVNPPAFVVNIELLKTKCPLLLSVFQETLRRYSFFSLMRVVTKNTVLADQYLLKKDSLVLIPNNVIHGNNSIWGPTAGETDFYRFTRNADNTKSAQIPPNNYRSFGQPPNLCPGRHFATTEIMATLAVLIMRFDFTPKLGKWETPPSYFAIFAAIMPPKKDLDVSISVRQECRGRWSFNLGNAAVKVPLVCG
jgi:cytochrome P450